MLQATLLFQETPEVAAFTEDQTRRHDMSPNALHWVAGKEMKGVDPMLDLFRRKKG
jgi:hypothetical protein